MEWSAPEVELLIEALSVTATQLRAANVVLSKVMCEGWLTQVGDELCPI